MLQLRQSPSQSHFFRFSRIEVGRSFQCDIPRASARINFYCVFHGAKRERKMTSHSDAGRMCHWKVPPLGAANRPTRINVFLQPPRPNPNVWRPQRSNVLLVCTISHCRHVRRNEAGLAFRYAIFFRCRIHRQAWRIPPLD